MKKKLLIHSIIAILFTCIALSLIYTFIFIKPSNDRIWEVGFEKLPRITINKHIVSIVDLRDYHYAPDRFLSANYINRTVDTATLERAWFVVEPFEGFPVIKFDGIAHTYFVFDFVGQKPVVVSVEARREKGEKFGLLPGVLNTFELMYVWGTEEDLTISRVLKEHNNLYMYPLVISKESAQKLFLQLAITSQKLETQPRFYNSFTSNCTNELAKNANAIKPGTIPFDLNWFLPGYTPKQLYNLGFIPHDRSFEEIKKKYFISDLVKQDAGNNNFSELLRTQILN